MPDSTTETDNLRVTSRSKAARVLVAFLTHGVSTIATVHRQRWHSRAAGGAGHGRHSNRRRDRW